MCRCWLFSVAVALVTGVLFGLVAGVAVVAARGEPGDAVEHAQDRRRGERTATHGVADRGADCADAADAGGGGRGDGRIFEAGERRLGYDPHNMMSVGIPVHEGTYKTWAERAAYFEQLRHKAATVPGVTMAAISTNATPPSNGLQHKFEILGKPSSAGADKCASTW